jgi:hypothetical protein
LSTVVHPQLCDVQPLPGRFGHTERLLTGNRLHKRFAAA